MKNIKVISALAILAISAQFGCSPANSQFIQCEISNGCVTEVDPSKEQSATDAPAGTPSTDADDILNNETGARDPASATGFELSDDLKHLDPTKIIPTKAFEQSLTFFMKYRTKFKNQNFLAIIDFTQKSTNKRLYLVDLKSGKVEPYRVAHGKNSDPDYDGFATKFSNVDGSLMSSLGAYMVAETYSGAHGYSVRLDGLESTNSNARDRAIVLHPADYVVNGGRSYGCPAVEPAYRDRIVNALKNGGLLYASY